MLRAMSWKKPSPALIETFDAVLPGPPAERRLMFGFPAAFVNGNMFMGLHEERFILRLDDGPREALLASGAKTFEPMKGRPMKEYVVAPDKLVGDRASLAKWVGKALAYGESLPSKAKKPSKKPAAKKKSK
jgi:TfoX/Sxy family transcriptional regulator of competence genes